LPKEFIWISDGSTRFDTLLAGDWRARGLCDGICSALREAFQYHSLLLDLGQSTCDGFSNGDRFTLATADCPSYSGLFEGILAVATKCFNIWDKLSISSSQKVNLIVSRLILFYSLETAACLYRCFRLSWWDASGSDPMPT
jgi:hypothetical protein